MRTNIVLGLGVIGVLTFGGADAAHNSRQKFKHEILTGLDIVNVAAVPTPAAGEMGQEVYLTAEAVSAMDMHIFVPTSMYMRMGGGLNLPFATDNAKYNQLDLQPHDSYNVQIGLGWNLSSFVRAELDFQHSGFKFKGVSKLQANYETVGGMLYFDLRHRYVMTGDVTRRRRFVPFVGVGAAVGVSKFDGFGGADGFVAAAPCASAGFNVMFNDLIGLDVMYQYQMMIGDGFGWDASSGATNISNIMMSLRANF